MNFKADIDPKDKQKTTPLHLAAKEGHVTAVETLIKHGARVSDRDYRGFNALDWAIENGHRFVCIKKNLHIGSLQKLSMSYLCQVMLF